MSCRETRAALHDHIEQTLPEARRQVVDAHLETCADCRKELSDLRASLALTRDLDDVEPPPFLAARIMARVRAESADAGWLRKLFLRPLRIPAGIAAAVCILFISLSVYTLRTVIEPPGLQPVDLTEPGQWRGTTQQLANHPEQDTKQQAAPDLQITATVQEIDPNARAVLRRLVEMNARILGISSDSGAYRITAEIDKRDRRAFILFMEQIGPNPDIEGGLSAKKTMLTGIALVKAPKNQ